MKLRNLLGGLLLALASAFAAASSLVVLPQQLVVDANGAPRIGAKLYVFDATTTTPRAAFTTSALAVQHAHPIESVSTGLFPAVYVNPSGGNYKLVLTDSADAPIWTEDNIKPSPLSQSEIGALLVPRTPREIEVGVTPAAFASEGRLLEECDADRYTDLHDAALVCEGSNGKLRLDGDTYEIDAPILLEETAIVEGAGSNTGATSGSVIENVTNDGYVFDVSGDVQRTVFRDFGVVHEAATKPAFRFLTGAAYGQFDNVVINGNSTGFGGVLFGDEDAETQAELDTANAEAWQATAVNLRCDDMTAYCVRINSTGHTWDLSNSSLRTSVASAVALEVNAPNTFVRGGQIGASGASGKPMYWYNRRGGLLRGGGSEGQKFENVGVGKNAIEIDGATQPWEALSFHKIGANLTTGVLGTVIKFGRCNSCWLTYPEIETPTGGGTLAEWGQNSQDCGVLVDYNGARAPVTVHASATRPVKRVYGAIPAANVTNITTATNLTVILQDGIPELPPGFVPVHNGTGWNYWMVTLADDAASSFTLPAVGAALVRSRVTVLSDGGVTFTGTAFVDADSGGAAVSAQGVGADFNTTTGALAGTTGTDAKVTLAPHTDGKIYLENRSGASRDFTVLIQPVIFGTDLFEPTNAVNDDFWLQDQAA
jgi:hypothetical protein